MGNVGTTPSGSGARLSSGERVVPISAASHIVEPDNCYRDHVAKMLFKESFHVTFNDYPHGDATWPNSQPLFSAHTARIGVGGRRP